ncbi:PEP-CTERM sorting domain-containing protein [Planctomyces sp. SH-PL62]|uniref:PEP-CTERM sorting domain-containing protein n=1 Tax=Planctomyces sp. SH-PL62 TaxID=1636152 RepID=UPI00078D7480|nr:PEP-CTERM sorting domain-containing protein [Planctomyces sp. SH-PL62]AMV37480.1 hypothetical protein VT85_08595 [Planctomyces sp. SH-PL62]
MTMRFLRTSALPLLALSLIAATIPTTRAAQVAATRAESTSYTISVSGVNGKPGASRTGSAGLAAYYSKISDSSQNGYNSAYGATGAHSGEIRTFCVDLRQEMNGNPTKFDYATVSNTSASALPDAQSPEWTRDLGRVGWLVANYSAGLVGGGFGWTGSALAGLNDEQRTAALQGAITVAEYGATGFSITGGSTANNTLVKNAITALVAASLGQSTLVGFIDYSIQANGSTAGFKNQDQAFAVPGSNVAAVPEPSTFAIAGLGALAFMGYGLRRRQAPAPTA